MYLTCLKTVVHLPREGFRLFSPGALPLLLDCHHGDTFVLKVTGLEKEAYSGPWPAEVILLELNLTPFEKVLTLIETFAAHHHLALSIRLDPAAGLDLPLTLAACHVPQARLFVYSEKARLSVRTAGGGDVLLAVSGDFQSRALPCQETDVVLHLERAEAGQVLSYLFRVLRERI